MIDLFLLLVLYQLKHFTCDYPLQNEYMLGKFKANGWILPLSAHAGVHALGTLVITISLVSPLLAVLFALFDFTIHFIMDRIKASPKLLGKFKADEKEFWWALGFDQMVHHITHYMIILGVIYGV